MCFHVRSKEGAGRRMRVRFRETVDPSGKAYPHPTPLPQGEALKLQSMPVSSLATSDIID
jgi:hypothetical protein